MNEPKHSTPGDRTVEARYEYTPNLADILSHLNASLLISTYQSQKVFVVGVNQGKVEISYLEFEQPMGVAVGKDVIAVGARNQIHFFSANHGAGITAEPRGRFDGCFVPRVDRHTGRILSHDLGWGQDGLWVVNTLFSCLCTLDEDSSFVPRWRPRFISGLADEDRCHLNGMAISNGGPSYVTALSETDTAAGWRPDKSKTGCVIDVASGEVLSRGLCMPHSPRVYNDQLWVLNSGEGSLGILDVGSGVYRAVEKVPGYTRGLAFCGQFAFVGLSRIRETNIFGGLPIAEKYNELVCGVGVVDLHTGRSVAKFQFHTAVEEIFAVDVILGFRNPLFGGATLDQSPRDVWIVPQAAADVPTQLPRSRSTRPFTQHGSSTPQGRLSQTSAAPITAAEFVEQGNGLQAQGKEAEAEPMYRRAIELDPRLPTPRQNLGLLLVNLGRPKEAVAEYEPLLRIAPTPLNRLLNALVLPVLYQSTAEIDEWRHRILHELDAMIDEGIVVDTTSTFIPTTFYLAYQGKNDREVAERISQIVRGPNLVEPRPAKERGKTRVGFVSAYFRDHTIGRLNLPTVRDLNRDKFEVVVFYAGEGTDPLSERFRQCASEWTRLPRDVAAARRMIAEKRLDVLIFADVGMDAMTSTLAWSRMAPVQCVTWGHPATTGSPCMDYFLSSERLESDDGQDHYTERLVRLPGLGIYYDRPSLSPRRIGRKGLGLPEDRRLYVCPQTLFKFHPDFDLILADILNRDPNGDLVLIKAKPTWTEQLRKRLVGSLPEFSSRVHWLKPMPNENFLSLLETADVLLDPIHFGGGNSSLEAIAIGTPVVTMPGKFLRSRITAALYGEHNCRAEFVASTPQEYVDFAIRAAKDRRRIEVPDVFGNANSLRAMEEFLEGLESN